MYFKVTVQLTAVTLTVDVTQRAVGLALDLEDRALSAITLLVGSSDL